MKILLLGSGGREHALAWKISQSSRLSRLYVAPGNAGTASTGTNVDLAVNDFAGIAEFVVSHAVDMVVVGPEDPLVKGIADYFAQHEKLRDLPVIGPSGRAAMLEGSKEFAKEFMTRHRIPTARFRSVTMETLDEGIQFLASLKPPYVLKADGLAAGKGVLILPNLEEAKQELKQMLSGKFGDAGKTVVLEEYLNGIELSVFMITDGLTYKLLPEAKDYKRVGESDTGPNTGGMGAVSPVPFADAAFMNKVETRIIKPTLEGLIQEKIDYRGFIFFGLMSCQGDPYVVEYNARLGDPESEVILPRLNNDIIELFEAVTNRTLSEKTISTDSRSVATVMLTSGGYPGSYEKGKVITGLSITSGCLIFHAGTRQEDNKLLTNGGRVLAVSAYGNNFHEALSTCYRNAAMIEFERKYIRADIGFDL
jgi:phosphoribosylamine--glycine ligase